MVLEGAAPSTPHLKTLRFHPPCRLAPSGSSMAASTRAREIGGDRRAGREWSLERIDNARGGGVCGCVSAAGHATGEYLPSKSPLANAQYLPARRQAPGGGAALQEALQGKANASACCRHSADSGALESASSLLSPSQTPETWSSWKRSTTPLSCGAAWPPQDLAAARCQISQLQAEVSNVHSRLENANTVNLELEGR